MTKIITFNEAIQHSKENNKKTSLLLGNGFSVSLFPDIFTYKSLYNEARDTGLFDQHQAILRLFESNQTFDFERILYLLKSTGIVLPEYTADDSLVTSINKDEEILKNKLVEIITKNHPESPDKITDLQYEYCRDFLLNFNSIYTTNYDLLLYWVTVKYLDVLKFKDGFDDPHAGEDPQDYVEEDYVSLGIQAKLRNTNMFFLHGAMHLYDAGYELRKYCFSRTGTKLRTQVLNAMSKGLYPLFVAEGHTKSKLERINHSAYLSKAYRSFGELNSGLFVFGLSFSENDDHVTDSIVSGTINNLYVSIYGDPSSKGNSLIINRVKHLEDKRTNKNKGTNGRSNLNVIFYDAATANIWGKSI